MTNLPATALILCRYEFASIVICSIPLLIALNLSAQTKAEGIRTRMAFISCSLRFVHEPSISSQGAKWITRLLQIYDFVALNWEGWNSLQLVPSAELPPSIYSDRLCRITKLVAVLRKKYTACKSGRWYFRPDVWSTKNIYSSETDTRFILKELDLPDWIFSEFCC